MEDVFFVQPITPIAIMMAAMAGLLGGTLAPAIVWNRLGLLGDTISHASLSIMAIGLLLGFSDQSLLVPFAIFIALALSAFGTQKFAELDAVLAVLFSGLMGLGLLLLSVANKNPAQVMSILTGDISSASDSDLILLSVWTAIVLGYLLKFRI
jgi:ABC-type Mn2+/Zn2+ transport system permease subunit